MDEDEKIEKNCLICNNQNICSIWQDILSTINKKSFTPSDKGMESYDYYVLPMRQNIGKATSKYCIYFVQNKVNK